MTDPHPAVERTEPPKGPFVVINAVMKGVLSSPLHGLVGGNIGLLSFTGRKSSSAYRTPVGVHDLDGHQVTLTSSGWRANFRGGAPVTLRLSGKELPLTATLVEDPDRVAEIYATLIDRFGHEKAGRRLGIKINVDRAPTREELIEAIERSRLSAVSYEPR